MTCLGCRLEPEVLIPLALATQSKTAVILAGDDKQLGPRLQSGFVREHELSSSVMDRMSLLPAYAEHWTTRGDLLLRFVKNYRAHAQILQFSSKTFYGDTLVAKAERAKADRFLNWTRLKNRDCPVLFVGVEGEDMREADSPSFFNPHEVVQVGKMVQVSSSKKKRGKTRNFDESSYFVFVVGFIAGSARWCEFEALRSWCRNSVLQAVSEDSAVLATARYG